MSDVTSTLEQFSEYVDTTLVDPLRAVLIGRKLVPVTKPHGLGKSSVVFHALTDMGDGTVSWTFSDAGKDVMRTSPTTLKMPIHRKDYTIDRRAYEAYRSEGIDFDSATALSAAFKAAKKEDATIIDGYAFDGTTYDVNGLYQGAGNTYGGASFATAGNPTKALAGAYAELETDDVPIGKMNLVLHPDQRAELRYLRSANGVKEEPEVLDALNGGAIYTTKVLTTGTALVLPAIEQAAGFFDFFLGVDWTTEHGIDSEHPDTSDLSGRVYSTGVLRIKHSEAICTITGI